MNSKARPETEGIKTIASNRRAFHDYEILERLEVGVVLVGSEMRPIRNGEVNIKDAWAEVEGDELWVHDLHIGSNPFANRLDHETRRRRKLLAHRREIGKLRQKLLNAGLTLIPLTMYLKRGRVKLELGLARGKRQYDKRETIARKDQRRDLERELSHRRS